MLRGPSLILGLIGVALAASAQDRPPTAPDEVRETRPPERTAAPTKADSEAAGDRFGPPYPEWARLQETEDDLAACKQSLIRLGAVFDEIAPITDPDDPDCGIAHPLNVTQILPGLALEGGAEMRCETALSLATWAHDFLLPAAATLPDAPRLTGLRPGSTYDCRARVGTGAEQPKISQHALGNAFDIAAFLFDVAEPLPVQPREETGDRAEAFQRAARATACLFFTTVLGPGANAAHDDHLHLDVMARSGGWRLCQ